jgi:hypothetical protein
VDTIVSTMAKLGERISPGAWIYALGNGLRDEFIVSKKGILYSEDGYGTVMSVKLKLLSEEAVLNSTSTKDSISNTSKETEKSDEIARASLTVTEKTKKPSTKTPNDSTEQALFFKGKGRKGSSKGKGHPKGRWSDPQWDSTWSDWSPPANTSVPQYGTWTPPSKGKGKGKDQGKVESDKGFDPQALWCDIHQRHGHSTDWCFDNPHRTGGPAPNTEGPWCTTCNRSGHTADSCYATSIRIPRKGKGKTKGGKGNYGNRAWKSQNFPAAYNSDQATPVLHDASSFSSTKDWWAEQELGSAIVDNNDHANALTPILDTYVAPNEPNASIDAIANPVPLHASLLDDYVERNAYDDDDGEYIADYIDLVLFAIVSNVERAKQFQLNPTTLLLLEIRRHSLSIVRAENCLNIHIQRHIQKFKSDIHYDGILSAIEDRVPNLHVQPIFFLDDANEDEIAAYIDLIIAAIRANLERHTAYLLSPSSPLQQEIRAHSTSIATAVSCTNFHIQRIIRNFKATVHYDAIMHNHTTNVEMAQTPHGNESQIANDNTAKAEMEQTPLEIANDNNAKTEMEQTPLEIANDNNVKQS